MEQHESDSDSFDTRERTVAKPSGVRRRRGCSRLLGGLFWCMVMLIAFRIGSCAYRMFSGPEPPEPSYEDYTFTNPYESNDTAICRDIVEDRLLDITVPDSPHYAEAAMRITSWMEKRVHDDFARTPEELGIDVRPLAELALGALSVDISSVSASPDSDEPHAQARVDAQTLSISEMYFEFQNNARGYMSEHGLSCHFNNGELHEEQKAQLRSYYEQAFSSNKTKMAFVTFELTKEDGTWVLDENEFSDGFRQLLHLPGPL